MDVQPRVSTRDVVQAEETAAIDWPGEAGGCGAGEREKAHSLKHLLLFLEAGNAGS